MTVPDDRSAAMAQALLAPRCGVCGQPYTSSAHRSVCMAGVSADECRCPPGTHLPDCVEVVGATLCIGCGAEQANHTLGCATCWGRHNRRKRAAA